MSFALYCRPGGVVFLDDDRDYLEMLAEVMPREWYVRLFLRPVACIELLHAQTPSRDAHAWAQQEMVNRWRDGALLIPQILQYWRDDGMARFALAQVAVVDYAMPAMSGLRVLAELARWSGSRILLTGRADEQLAISAFNRGLIDQFIPKQSPDIRLRLSEAIQEQRHRADPRHQQIWRATLSPRHDALLCDPLISAALQALARRHGWIEHIVIGAPLSLLALDAKGMVSWLQLEPAEDLGELADMALSQGWDAALAQDLRSGKKLLDLELQLALGASHEATPCEAFVLPGESTRLYAALFPLGAAASPGPLNSYERFLNLYGERALHDQPHD